MNDNGYKVCYREKGRTRFKRHWACNTYSGAEWQMKFCMRVPQKAKDGHVLREPTWKIFPITNAEIAAIRKKCPFDFP